LSKVCDVCGKKLQPGNKVSHANNKSNRFFRPNLQSISVIKGGSKVRMKVCTRCIRTGTITKAV